jgi:catechol 2,3-dioxygenase-like lactoylglutathione lyase family enzyme
MAFTGISSVLYGTPDLALARKLFADWGLTAVSRSKAVAAFQTGVGGDVIARPENATGLPPRISESSNFREIIWGVSDQKHLVSLAEDLSRDRAVTLDKAGGIHTTDDSGIHIGFRVWKPAPIKRGKPTVFNQPRARARVNAVGTTYARATPHRIGHAAFFVPDVKVAELFYVKRLGFWLSDRYAGGAAVFMRYAARCDHHNLFMLKSRGGNVDLHHFAYEVNDVHEVFGGGLAFSRSDWPTAVGPGRHPISSAYFWYFRNPLGGMMEYFCDPDYVTEKWQPHNYKINRFSEWHQADGIKVPQDLHMRPSLAMAKSIAVGAAS